MTAARALIRDESERDGAAVEDPGVVVVAAEGAVVAIEEVGAGAADEAARTPVEDTGNDETSPLV